jgi:hypothetical protein
MLPPLSEATRNALEASLKELMNDPDWQEQSKKLSAIKKRMDEREQENLDDPLKLVQADMVAFDRIEVLLTVLMVSFPKKFGNLLLMKADKTENGFPTYSIRKKGFFGSKPVPEFSRGRARDVERQLRTVIETALGKPITDDELDKLLVKFRMMSITRKR